LVVVDFGVNSCDATVVTRAPDGIRVVAARTDPALGGRGVDAGIRRWLDWELALRNPPLLQEISSSASHSVAVDLAIRRAKEQLSDAPTADIALATPTAHDTYTLTRETIASLSLPEMVRVQALVAGVLDDARAAGHGAITSAYLTGGSSRLPGLVDAVGRHATALVADQPELANALGALLAVAHSAAPATGSPPAAPRPAPAAPATEPDPPPPPRRRGFLIVTTLTVPAAIAVGVILAVQHSTSSSSSTTGPNTILVGQGPDGIAFDPATHTIFVANGDGGSVSVINTATNTVTTTIHVGQGPVGIALDPTRHTAYTANETDGSVSVINTATNTVTTTIHVGGQPEYIAVDPNTDNVYVDNGDGASGDNTVSVINAAGDTVTGAIHIGGKPEGLAVDPGTHTAYVATDLGDDSATAVNAVTVVNTAANAVTATIPVNEHPELVAVDPENRIAYVTDSDKTVAVINTADNTVTTTDTIGFANVPDAAAFDPGRHTAYLTNLHANTVSVIDTATNRVIATYPVGTRPDAVAVDPNTHTAYVTNQSDNTVTMIRRPM
jgi:YVTN family beta-propeller protein